MSNDIFLIKTSMIRTESGLILPNRQGEAFAIIGTLATAAMRPHIEAMDDAEMAPHEACIIVDVSTFWHAAIDFVRDRPSSPQHPPA